MNIVFFYPSRNIGGVQTLFSRLAVILSDKVSNVYIIDYKDGIYRELIDSEQVKMIDYIEGRIIRFTESVVLITPASNLSDIFQLFDLKSEDSVLFWMVHPFNIIVNFPLFRFFSKLSVNSISKLFKSLYKPDQLSAKVAITILIDAGNFVFMDYECFEVNRKVFDLNLTTPTYLPIPVAAWSKPVQQNTKGSLCWLGRVEDFKTNILIKVVDDFLSYSASQLDANFIIIGSGKDIESVKLRYSKNPRVIFVDRLLENELHEYLIKHVSVMFAMGTSALESAKLGIPTILLDACYTSLPESYRYRWLHHTKGFTLGRILDSNYVPSETDLSFEEVIDDVQVNYKQVSRECFSYYKFNHSLESCANSLFELLNNLKTVNETGNFIHGFRTGKSYVSKLVNLIKRLKND